MSFDVLPKVGAGHHRYGIATYPGVIDTVNNKSSLPAVRLNPNTSQSSRIAPSAGSSMSSNTPNSSFIYKKLEVPFLNNHNKSDTVLSDILSGHRAGGYPHYNNNYNPPLSNVVSTHRPLIQGSQLSPSRLPHAPYHPYHPSQLTSTPTPHWWRPHFTKQRHNYDASRSADQGYAYKKTFKGMFGHYYWGNDTIMAEWQSLDAMIALLRSMLHFMLAGQMFSYYYLAW